LEHRKRDHGEMMKMKKEKIEEMKKIDRKNKIEKKTKKIEKREIGIETERR